ncbi:MAG: DNA replication/repair protein RecF, partial [Anaerolineales bacterium]
MWLKHLSLTNFRNYARLDIDVPKGLLLISGNNAQGKTSLIEAIYFLSSFVSFHAENDRQLIHFLVANDPLAVGRIVADFETDEDTQRLEVRIIQERENGNGRLRKEILLNGVKQKMAEAVGKFKAVIFLPQSLLIIEGAPEERRRFLNLALSQVLPHYAAILAEYVRALNQRNALLKQLSERGGDVSQLDYWDNELSQLGARMIYARIHAIMELEALASPIFHKLTHENETLSMNYQPSFEPMKQNHGQYSLAVDIKLDRRGLSLEQIQEGFRQRLRQLRNDEISRGVTTIGPHRDDIRFLSNGIDLGVYGSRGQIRTAILALKFAEMHWIREKSGSWPVFLLD